MTLYEIDKALMDFEFEVDEETGEILNASDLDELQMARQDKIENIGLYIKNLEAEKEAVKHEKDNLVICYALMVMAHDADERAEEFCRKWKEKDDE